MSVSYLETLNGCVAEAKYILFVKQELLMSYRERVGYTEVVRDNFDNHRQHVIVFCAKSSQIIQEYKYKSPKYFKKLADRAINYYNSMESYFKRNYNLEDAFIKFEEVITEMKAILEFVSIPKDKTIQMTGISKVINQQQSKPVFIVHGHDELNALRLFRFLTQDLKLRVDDVTILNYIYGKGLTIIEKLEQEGAKMEFAFVLWTPDDHIIQSNGTTYNQPRPNVLIEHGWFYGKLGRQKVCLLYKQGTKIPSDFEGISRVEFVKSVDETQGYIMKELVGAGLLQI